MRSRKRFNQAVRRRVVVHTREGYSLEGVLSGVYADGVTVTAATFLRTDGEPNVPLDGEMIIPWANISFVQEMALLSTNGHGELNAGS